MCGGVTIRSIEMLDSRAFSSMRMSLLLFLTFSNMAAKVPFPDLLERACVVLNEQFARGLGGTGRLACGCLYTETKFLTGVCPGRSLHRGHHKKEGRREMINWAGT